MKLLPFGIVSNSQKVKENVLTTCPLVPYFGTILLLSPHRHSILYTICSSCRLFPRVCEEEYYVNSIQMGRLRSRN